MAIQRVILSISHILKFHEAGEIIGAGEPLSRFLQGIMKTGGLVSSPCKRSTRKASVGERTW